MRILTFILVLVSLNTVAQDKWFAKDKALHFSVSATFTPACIETMKDWNFKYPEIKGMAVMFGAGIAKEVFYDNRISYKDLVADFTGCIAGYYLNKLYQNIDSKRKMKRI